MNFKHPEAFCLLEYRCDKCKHGEILWNSRDGVTPFAINCLICKGPAYHTDRGNRSLAFGEQLKLGHNPGMRLFVNTTREKADFYATNRIKTFRDQGVPTPTEGSAEYKELHKQVSDEIYHDGESADVITGREFYLMNLQTKGLVM